MKKLLASLLIVCTLLGCMMISINAGYNYDQSTVLEWTMKKDVIKEFTFEPTDITGATALKFDLYLESAADFGFTSFEIGTHPHCDWKEKQVNGAASFGTLVNGWNTVSLDLASIPESNDWKDANDGSVAGFDYSHLCRIRIFNVNVDGKETNVKLKNIVAVKGDTEIKVGGAPVVLDTGVLEGNVRTYAFELYQDSEAKYLRNTTAGDNGTQRFSDAGAETVYAFGMVDTDKIEKVEFSAKLGCQLLLQVSNDAKNWVEVYKYTEVVPDHPEAGADVKVYDFDLTDKWTKGDALYIRIADSSPENGWGGSIFKDNVNTLKVTYKSDAPVDDPTPATFDAVSSVAVAAVAALGVALVASKKRH
ncbi:MAG: hypothetical protein MJ070_07240 [Lachnospiraceae bacterium]|nr:hypothetical protein [Lachnospiraceae bacterium]